MKVPVGELVLRVLEVTGDLQQYMAFMALVLLILYMWTHTSTLRLNLLNQSTTYTARYLANQ